MAQKGVPPVPIQDATRNRPRDIHAPIFSKYGDTGAGYSHRTINRAPSGERCMDSAFKYSTTKVVRDAALRLEKEGLLCCLALDASRFGNRPEIRGTLSFKVPRVYLKSPPSLLAQTVHNFYEFLFRAI